MRCKASMGKYSDISNIMFKKKLYEINVVTS